MAYIDEHLANSFIIPSKSPAAAPTFFVKKKDGCLQLCMEYHGLNKVMGKNQYPLPLIAEVLDHLQNATIFSKIDLHNTHHQICIAEGDEWKTVFITCYGLFEYQVMPFGLTIAPTSFQNLVNATFHSVTEDFIIAYLDDVMIFSNNRTEHTKHVRGVLQHLREAPLYAKPEKCRFYFNEVEFFGYKVSCIGIFMDPVKVRAVMEWPQLTPLTELRSFLGFDNFYCQFIKDHPKVVGPLTKLTCTTMGPFKWNDKATQSFEDIKSAFTHGDILHHYDPTWQITI